jgi:hypothetical protein
MTYEQYSKLRVWTTKAFDLLGLVQLGLSIPFLWGVALVLGVHQGAWLTHGLAALAILVTVLVVVQAALLVVERRANTSATKSTMGDVIEKRMGKPKGFRGFVGGTPPRRRGTKFVPRNIQS